MLAVIETHPIQYHAPVYRAVQQEFGVPVTAIYGSDFSVAGYRDPEFGAVFAWDTDLLFGYSSLFLGRIGEGGARSPETTSTRGLGAALRALAPAAVLLVGYSPRFHQLACVQAWRTGRPLLLRAETTDHAVHRGGIKRWLRDRGLRWFYQRCSRLLYVGQRSNQHFRRLGLPDAKLVFSPYCVDTTAFELDEAARMRLRSSTRRSLSLNDEHKVLLLSGKVVHRKRPDLLLHAIRKLPPHLREKVHVLVLGSGDQQPAFEALARESPAVGVTCVGFRHQRSLSAYYHAADLLVLPSESGETWGLVVNEALHHGVPCVVSEAVGSAPDLIRPASSGEVFETGSAASLALALERSWRLMGSAQVREDCRRTVSGYTVGKAAEGIARAYHEAVKRGA
ncbi:MAG: glycosyltransferase family 4 protein [Chloroflexota bacterium]|nr:glycosyltransferase family 4 protein [Chloroflexota bacterium]